MSKKFSHKIKLLYQKPKNIIGLIVLILVVILLSSGQFFWKQNNQPMDITGSTPAPTCQNNRCLKQKNIQPKTPLVKNNISKKSKIVTTSTAQLIASRPTSSIIHLPILMYHYVESITSSSDQRRISLTTDMSNFELQLKALNQAGYTSYFVADVPQLLVNNNKNAVILTFDDGYEDFYTDVVPLLEKYRVKGTVYVIYHALDTKNYLTSQQLIELSKNPWVEIGSHTIDHPNLAAIQPRSAEYQIGESKALLEKLINHPVNTFAYPFGAHNASSSDIVKQFGYTAAVSTLGGSLQNQSNPWMLHRLRPGNATNRSFLGLL
ncbi:MAG: polysaccharide deacetylase family protein [Candidatus Falkowbacteria bacterium]